ncbi:MAG: hypothetical protein AB1861_24895 [Cyanobacteriota bacterium]
MQVVDTGAIASSPKIQICQNYLYGDRFLTRCNKKGRDRTHEDNDY